MEKKGGKMRGGGGSYPWEEVEIVRGFLIRNYLPVHSLTLVLVSDRQGALCTDPVKRSTTGAGRHIDSVTYVPIGRSAGVIIAENELND